MATRKDKHMKEPAKTKIEWPADWAEDEGWPTRNSGPAPGDLHGRTWADLDDAMKRQGTSLVECAEALAGTARKRDESEDMS